MTIGAAVAEPADSGRQSLERDPCLGHLDPSPEGGVLRKQVENGSVGREDVVRVAGKGGPAERPLALAKQRPDERRHEAREVERVRHAGGLRLGPDVVPVVERDRACLLEGKHRLYLLGHRSHRPADVLGGRGRSKLGGCVDGEPCGYVAVQRVMRGRLVRDDVEPLAAADEFRLHFRGVADERDGFRATGGRGLARPGEGFVEIVGQSVHVADVEAAPCPRFVHFDDERHALVHRDGEWLGPSHAAETRRQGHSTAQRPTKVLAGQLGKGFVRALENSLRPDVDPRAGRHLPVHREPGSLEAAEVVPVRPLADEIRVGDEDARRPFARPEHADRLAGLDEQRFVVLESAQLADDRVESVPAPRRAAGSAVDHEIVGPLGNLGIEVVHEHPQGRFLNPALAAQL